MHTATVLKEKGFTAGNDFHTKESLEKLNLTHIFFPSRTTSFSCQVRRETYTLCVALCWLCSV